MDLMDRLVQLRRVQQSVEEVVGRAEIPAREDAERSAKQMSVILHADDREATYSSIRKNMAIW